MKKHHKTTKILTVAASALLMFSFSTTETFATSVIESQLRAQTRQQNSDLAAMNGSMERTAAAAEATSDAVGAQGANPNAISPPVAGAVGASSEFYQNMERFGYDMCAVTLCRNSDPVGTKDIDEARDWAMENFFASDVIADPVRRDLLEIRRRGLVYASTNGLSLAVTIHNELAGADGAVNALESQVASSGDLRKDIQANSAILIAQYKVALQELAVLNSLLVVESMNGIYTNDLYHEDGGTSFADALNDDDFSDPGFSVRTKVTAPGRGTAPF